MLVLLLVQLHVSPAYFIGQIILQERHVSRAAIGKLYSNINDPRATQPPADIRTYDLNQNQSYKSTLIYNYQRNITGPNHFIKNCIQCGDVYAGSI